MNRNILNSHIFFLICHNLIIFQITEPDDLPSQTETYLLPHSPSSLITSTSLMTPASLMTSPTISERFSNHSVPPIQDTSSVEQLSFNSGGQSFIIDSIQKLQSCSGSHFYHPDTQNNL